MDQLPPLHWLSTYRSESSLLPGYARLKRSGISIFDDGYLDPPLSWINGAHSKRGTWQLPISAYELLRNSADTWLKSVKLSGDERSEDRLAKDPSNVVLSPQQLLETMPSLQWPRDCGGELFFSPRIAFDTLPAENFRSVWQKWIFMWIRRDDGPGAICYSTLTDPHQLIRASYRWICELLEKRDIESEYFAAALTSFALGALGAFPRIDCQVCYRLAIPQRLRCEHHHMSTIVHGAQSKRRSDISQSARAAKRVARRLNWESYRPTIGRFFLNPIEERTISEILWGLPSAENELLSRYINMALVQAPDIAQMLPDDFQTIPVSARIEILRTTLDPREWISKVWPEKIIAAQEWLNELKAVTPRTRKGFSVANQQRLQQIDAWLAAGVKKSEIASRLEISPSHLSKILSRRPG